MNTNDTNNIDKNIDKGINEFIYEQSTRVLIENNIQSMLQSSVSHDREIFLYNAGSIIIQLYIIKELATDSINIKTSVCTIFAPFLIYFLVLIVYTAIKSTFYLLRSNKLAKDNFLLNAIYTRSTAEFNMKEDYNKDKFAELNKLRDEIDKINIIINKLFNKSHHKAIATIILLGAQLISMAMIIFLIQFGVSIYSIVIIASLTILIYLLLIRKFEKQAKNENRENNL
jgi:hypothetical protein